MPVKSNRPQISPQLRQLESWPTERESPASGEMWEVSAPSKKSLSWSIVLSYVISMKQGNLQKQFELLLGSKDEMKEVMAKKKISPGANSSNAMNPEAIKNQIMAFNPFKNHHAFYFNPLMINVFRIFDLRLNRHANSIQKDVQWGNPRKLEAASQLLDCQIQVYETDRDGNKTLHSFPREQSVPCRNGQIVIFQHSGIPITENINDVFAFGMTIDHALPLRMKALRYILEVAKLNVTDIEKLLQNFQGDMDFLYFLVRTSKHTAIPILYESPYIPLKLTEAGFNTNPFHLEQSEGPSVFYYCLHPENNDALIALYNYACNNRYMMDETTRNPGSEILSALEATGTLIQKYFPESDGHYVLRNEEITKWLQILRFNKYQCGVVKSILELKKLTEDLEYTSEMIVCSIFRLYNEYFLFEEFESFNNIDYGRSYVQYCWYYESIDSFTCLHFFDIILSLSNYDHLMDTTISLFLTVLAYKYFPKCNHVLNNTPCDLSEIFCGLGFVAFDNRRHFLQNTKHLLNEIESNSINRAAAKNQNKTIDEKVMKKRVDNIRQKLSNFPELKDELSIIRFRVNMNSALNVSLETSGIKGVLVIERALQVIGETLCPSRGGECILSCLLSACIPQDLTNQLIETRHFLSHTIPAFVCGRLYAEQHFPFKDLQKLLNQLNESFKFVYNTQEFRLILMLLVRSKREAETFSRDVFEKLSHWEDRMIAEKNQLYQNNHDKFILLIDNVLNFFLEKLKRDDYKKAGKYGEITALDFLYNSLSTTFSKRDQFLNAIREMKAFGGHGVLEKNSKDDLISIVSKQSELIRGTLNLTSSRLSFQNHLRSFCGTIHSHNIFSDKDIEQIRTNLKTLLENSATAKSSLRNHLVKKTCLTPLEHRQLLNTIVMSEKKRENISGFLLTNSKKKESNALSALNGVKDESIPDMLKMSAEKLMEFLKKEELRRPMTLISIPASLQSKITEYLNWRVPFLLSRIDHLKKILIEEDYDINQLWQWGRSTAIKKHTRFLMRTRYIKEREVHASLDMLLFDCHNVLPDREDLKRLWTKANKLYTGIDLRDVISHGNILLQAIGENLDPEDLPTELIDKMLELIEDGDAVREMKKLYEKLKPNSRLEFEKAVEESCDPIPEKIKECKKWKSYIDIFPLR